MKILIVCQYYYPENFVITNIAEELFKYGHEVHVLTGKPNYGYNGFVPGYEKVKDEVINGVKIHRVNLVARKHNRLSIIRNYLSFWKNSKKWVKKCKESFDVVYSMSLSPVTILAAGNLYKKIHHVPHVVHCVDLWPESVLITKAVPYHSLTYKFLYKWSHDLYEKVDHVLIGSPSYEKYFRDVLNFKEKPLTFIPQPSLVESLPENGITFEEGYTHILYCGNLGKIQLIDMMPKAMNLLKDEKIILHVIGMGPKANYLKEQIETLKLENIKYYGPIPAKKASAYFNSADAIYVSLSKEGYVGKTIPNKLIMSMAMGKPVVAMLDGDGRTILNNSNGGIAVDENETDLANAFIKISKMSSEEKNMLGCSNRAYYLDNFSIQKVSKEIEQILLSKLR